MHYQDVCKQFKWRGGEWVPLKFKAKCLGRVMNVNPSPRNMELFYLRCLVMNVPGAKSFGELKTINGRQCETYRDACLALGLETDDSHYEKAMVELVAHATPHQIRMCFAVMMIHCQLLNCRGLWLKYRQDMAFDHIRRGVSKRGALVLVRRQLLDLVASLGGDYMVEIEKMLTVPSRTRVPFVDGMIGNNTDDASADSMAQECLPSALDELQVYFSTDEGERQSENDAVTEDLSVTLNDDQARIFNEVMSSLTGQTTGRQRLFTVTGSAGTGKTHLYKALIYECERRGIKCVASAYTGIASSLLPGGKTCHLTFGIPSTCRRDGSDVTYLECCSEQGRVLEQCGLVVIDEMSMLAKYQIEIVDKCLRMIDDCDTCMGNKVVLLGGDMRQILPFVKGLHPENAVQESLLNWSGWSQFEHLKLTQNMRARDDERYADWVSRVGDGTANEPITSNDLVLPDDIVLDCNSRDENVVMDSLIEKVFGNEITERSAAEGVIMCPTNEVVNSVNERVLKKFKPDTVAKTYLSHTKLIEEGQQTNETDRLLFDIQQDELDGLSPSNLPPHKLSVKEGCVVMLLKNIAPDKGLCNGTRLVVKKALENVIGVQRVGDEFGEIFFIPKMNMRSNEVPVHGSVMRHQFPLRLGFAMTINKSQGQTLVKAGLLLRKPVFAHGQMFVAVSRVKRAADMTVAVVPGPEQGRLHRGGRLAGRKVVTKNIVYRQVLCDE